MHPASAPTSVGGPDLQASRPRSRGRTRAWPRSRWPRRAGALRVPVSLAARRWVADARRPPVWRVPPSCVTCCCGGRAWPPSPQSLPRHRVAPGATQPVPIPATATMQAHARAQAQHSALLLAARPGARTSPSREKGWAWPPRRGDPRGPPLRRAGRTPPPRTSRRRLPARRRTSDTAAAAHPYADRRRPGSGNAGTGRTCGYSITPRAGASAPRVADHAPARRAISGMGATRGVTSGGNRRGAACQNPVSRTIPASGGPSRHPYRNPP